MTDDHIEADRLVELAANGVLPTAAEDGHLAACADCRLERQLLSSARRLGTDAVLALDPAVVAARVRERLAGAPAPVAAWHRPKRWLTMLAAAAVLLFVVRLSLPERHAVPAATVLNELDGLSSEELEVVLATIPATALSVPRIDEMPLSELTADDLERVLRSMEDL
ncbi:MAG: hypothetical protein HOP28_03645 [Gemmatimonadales bacterium]|nr:hypothetical protein [Gemmatimonadales bacterium]